MKRRAASFLLCVCFCFCSLSLSSSAVDDEAIFNPGSGDFYVPEEFEEPEITEPEESTTLFQGDPEMLADGFTYDPYLDAYLLDGEDFAIMEEPPSPFFEPNPNYPDFNPNMVPWESAPDEVKEILFNTPFIPTSEGDHSYVDPWKIPFCMVWTNGFTVRVVVGINLFLGTYIKQEDISGPSGMFAPTGTYVMGRLSDHNGVLNGSEYICAYQADFNLSDMSISVDWQKLKGTSLGTHFVYFTGNIFGFENYWDYYCYGGNCVAPGYEIECSMGINDYAGSGLTWPRVFAVCNSSYGFRSGKYLYYQDMYDYSYINWFVPSTYEEREAETSKGILSGVKGLWESVKQLPDLIGDKIKNLFVPSEGFFSTYITSYQDYFKDRFGLVYEVPDSIVALLQQFIDFTPAESGYSIAFPEVVLPVLNEEGEWSERTLIQATDIKFDFLEQGAFKTMYSLYRSAIWMFYIFALINLIIRKSKSIFGGYE